MAHRLTHPFGSILITGASSGIGAAFALRCAAPEVRLHLSGRDEARLEQVAATCLDRGALVSTRLLDVTDARAMQDWITAAGPLDLVVANAGLAIGRSDGGVELAEATRATFAANLDGVMNTVLPALRVMEAQSASADGWRGRVAVVSSVTAFFTTPSAPSYCASKAAVDAWTVAAGAGYRRHGILLTSVCPGFVRSGMTAGWRRALPGTLDAEQAAERMLRGIIAGRRRLVFPWWAGALARLVGLLPPGIAFGLRDLIKGALRRRPQPAPAVPALLGDARPG